MPFATVGSVRSENENGPPPRFLLPLLSVRAAAPDRGATGKPLVRCTRLVRLLARGGRHRRLHRDGRMGPARRRGDLEGGGSTASSGLAWGEAEPRSVALPGDPGPDSGVGGDDVRH